MIKPISKIAEFEAQLKENNQIFYLDEPKHIAIMVKMNQKMSEIRKDYRAKEKKSRLAASKVRLT